MYAAAQRATQPVRMKDARTGALDRAMARHPVLTLTAAMLLTGAGMVLAVTVSTVLCMLPIAFLMGWL